MNVINGRLNFWRKDNLQRHLITLPNKHVSTKLHFTDPEIHKGIKLLFETSMANKN